MTSPLDQQVNDLGVRFIPPSSPVDPRVPLAEEFSLDTQILVETIRRSRLNKGWITKPNLGVFAPRKLAISGGVALMPVYPGVLSVDCQIEIPSLPTSNNVVKQEDSLYLVAFTAEVGAAQDPILGQISFQYRDQASQNIVSIQKENARRIRAFWLLVNSTNPLDPASFLNALTLEQNGDRRLTVPDNSDIGFALGGFRIYAKDPNLSKQVTYTVFPNSVEILTVCAIKRIQRYGERGYTWGYAGEDSLSLKFNVVHQAEAIQQSSPETLAWERAFQIFAGSPGAGSTYSRAIQNLTSGPVPGNPGNDGESAGSPNNSVCLANDQRVSFSNQAINQRTSAAVIAAGNDGNGNALVAIAMNTSVPDGTFFSENRLDHRIFSTSGVDCTSLGTFSNLGGTGALVWKGGDNSPIKPGSQVIVSPAVRFPAGSGLSIPFDRVEKVWRNGVPLSAENIRTGFVNDLIRYEDPANNEDFFLVAGAERAAIHYILKRIVATSDVNGTLIIPSSEKGNFAFIEGVSERVDAPVKTGLAPNTAYKALVYYPPRTLESWQLQVSYPKYQGTGADETNFLNDAVVITRPLFFAHTQGGGLSVYQGEGSIRYSPISMHLPATAAGLPAYRMNAPVQITGEAPQGPVTFRGDLQVVPGAGLILPSPGQKLKFVPATGIQSRSLSGKLLANNQSMGFRTPLLAGKEAFQSVLVFMVQKGTERRLVIATRVGNGGENAVIDSEQLTAFDIFRI